MARLSFARLQSSPVLMSSIPLPVSLDSTIPPRAPEGYSGFPEVSSGLISPPSSPPLAALTSANELALIRSNSSKKRDNNGKRISRKEGAAYTIRGECERLFCENMKSIFLGEEGRMDSNGSIVMGTNNAYSPPDDSVDAFSYFSNNQRIDAWLEIWDYTSGCSFRAFVGGNGDKKSLFIFFDASVIGRDLKQGLMELIELAEEVFAVSHIIICVDRSVRDSEKQAFMKSLRWVGFELITLDMWASVRDVTSNKWLFMGMEI